MIEEPVYDDAFFERLAADHDKSRKKRGTKLPRELEKALAAIQSIYLRSWDDAQIPATLRPADIQVCLPPTGLSVLIECKETKEDRIAFSRIDDYKHRGAAKGNRQRRSLMLHTMAGGLSLVAVQRCWSNRSRTWILSWQHWEKLRRDTPRESIPLDDARRPTSLHEVGLLRKPELFSALMVVRQSSLLLPIIDYRISEGDR